MKKKILFIMPSLAGGGTEKVLIDILRNIDFDRYDISLFLEFGDGVYMNDIPVNAEVLSLYKSHSIWHDRLFRLLRMFHWYIFYHSIVYKYLIRRLLKKRRFDTIVSFMEGNALRFHSYVLDKADKHISWIHIDLKKKHWSLDFFRDPENECAAYNHMDRIICVSEDVKRSFLELYPMLSDKCSVIYNPIDRNWILKEAEQKQVDKQKFTICMVGRLNPQKRYDRALAVVKRLKEENFDFELWILGQGDLETDLRAMVATYGINDCVRFLGFKKPPYPYMKAADVFLNTSEAEGYPLVVCEALCLGIPVVGTRISGTSEILENSEYGLLTDETEDAIFEALKRLMEDKTLLRHYGERASLRANIFEIHTTMIQIYQIF